MYTDQTPQSSPQSTSLPHTARPRAELWLYDERHHRFLLDSGVLDPYDPLAVTKYRALAKQGVMVACHLGVSPAVAVSARVGQQLGAEQLGALHGGRWLAPRTALLDLPSGRLCFESRDRLGAQPADADVEPSGQLLVAPGRYRLTLHVSEDELRPLGNMAPPARHHLLVLTPGGAPRDAVDHVLTW